MSNNKPIYNPNIHHRRSIRLKGYDYSNAGLYFITICCQKRACFFGNTPVGAPIVGAQNADNQNLIPQNSKPQIILNDAGNMITAEWLKLQTRFLNIVLHEFVVMPNHFHGILQIANNTVGVTLVGTLNADGKKTVGDIMDAFKSITTVEYIRGVKKMGWPPFDGKLWQRNFHEHIIRNEESFHTISNYIISNPLKWTKDKFYNH
jgi:putative transposase